jgi:hypothetical protein
VNLPSSHAIAEQRRDHAPRVDNSVQHENTQHRPPPSPSPRGEGNPPRQTTATPTPWRI